jgi:hypothetical protein
MPSFKRWSTSSRTSPASRLPAAGTDTRAAAAPAPRDRTAGGVRPCSGPTIQIHEVKCRWRRRPSPPRGRG